LVEALVPNLIGSSLVGGPYPSTANQTTTATPLGIGKRKKRVAHGTKCKQDQVPADQVIIELPPYRRPRNPLDLVVIEHIFGRLFEAFRLASQATRTGTSAGEDAQPSKRSQALSLKRMILPKYMLILLLFILSLTLIFILTT
jgi:hypothetical protein